jgi:hypothetical protein
MPAKNRIKLATKAHLLLPATTVPNRFWLPFRREHGRFEPAGFRKLLAIDKEAQFCTEKRRYFANGRAQSVACRPSRSKSLLQNAAN